MQGLKTPDLTPGAIISLASAFLTNLSVIFWPGMTPEVKGAIVGCITVIVLAAFLIHDAIIRKGRAQMVAEVAKASGEQGFINPD
jgi:hypothetical protein